MSEITREEITANFATVDARMAAHEARVDARLASMDGKIDRLKENFDGLRFEVRGFRSEIIADGKTTRLTIVITLIASLLAFAGAMWTAQANLLAAFQAGLAKQAVLAPVSSVVQPPLTAAPVAPAKPERKASLADAR